MSEVAWVFPAFGHSANDEVDYGHPAHQGFQRSIDADPLLFSDINIGAVSGTLIEAVVAARGLPVSDHSTYILENAIATYSAPRIKRSNDDATVIQIAADYNFFGLQSYQFDYSPMSFIRRGERHVNYQLLKMILRRHVDGAIAVSELFANKISEVAPSLPVKVAHPYVQPTIVNLLRELSPGLDSNQAVTVCEHRDHKGVDLLVNAWPLVRDRLPEAELTIVGEGHPKEWGNVPGVTVRGYVKDLTEIFENSSLYVQPARADAFPVTVLEAMQAGLVPIVTKTTGSQSLVSKLNNGLIVEPEPSALASGIVQYFEQDKEQRCGLSESARKIVNPFSAEVKQQEFQDTYKSLLAEI